jgi:tRNA (cytidine/uridine-2'-O-)-methyltransferase
VLWLPGVAWLNLLIHRANFMTQRPKPMTHDLHIALYQPEIPGNTGAILRLAACFGATVDIIHPIGFELSDKTLKRAGMDYLEIAAIREHADFEAFEDWRATSGRRLVLLTTKATTAYADFFFRPDDILMFGRESSGVPDDVAALANAALRIPIRPEARSLNLGMSAAITLSEAVRQLREG